MKKSSKIWKIEKYGHEFKSGCSVDGCYSYFPRILSRQFIYNTELDCLLDIVTEQENNDLKVYKHQTVEKTNIDRDSCIEYAYIKLNNEKLSDVCSYLSDVFSYCISIAYSRDEIEKMDPNSYRLTWPEMDYQQSYTKTVYYWVEAYLQ